MLDSIIEIFRVSFFISLPVIVLTAVAQWVLQFRLFFEPEVEIIPGLLCILYSQISAYILTIIIWISWPIDPELILYNERISIPTVIAEIIAIPYWLKHYGYIFTKQS